MQQMKLLRWEQAIDRRPLKVTPDTTLQEAIAIMGKAKSSCMLPGFNLPMALILMNKARASAVLVVDGSQLRGIFTETDAVRAIASGKNLDDMTVGEVIPSSAIALPEAEAHNIFTALSLLRQHQIRHLPVVDAQQQPVGIITLESLHQALQLDELLKSRCLSEAMNTPVIQAPPSASIMSIAQLMQEHQVSHVVIIEEEKGGTGEPEKEKLSTSLPTTQDSALSTLSPILAGIITQRDIVQLQSFALDIEKLQAQEVMSTPCLAFSPSQSVLEVFWEMQQSRVQQVVVSQDAELKGILTPTSFLQTLDITEMAATIEQLQQSVEEFAAQKATSPNEGDFDLDSPSSQESPAELRQQLQCYRLLTEMALRIRESLELDEILHTSVAEVRQFLQTDRVLIYRFNPDLSGTVVVESAGEGWEPALNSTIKDTCFGKDYAHSYKEGRIQVTEDIYTAGLSQCHIDILTLFDIRANLVVPILQNDHLWGLLCAYNCSGPRRWREYEIDLLKQLATQIAIAIQQSELYQQVQTELAERKRAEEKLKVSLKEKEILLKEIHHRVKNNLQIISSLLRLQSSYIKDEEARLLFKDSQNRIRSMALIHEKLYQSKDLSKVNFVDYIRDLSKNLLRSYSANTQLLTVESQLDSIPLSIDTAIPCGLIVNELVSNALKHAFPNASSDNRITIELQSQKKDQLTLIVSDNGVGFPEDLNFRKTKSLGLELVCTLAEQLSGTIELNSSQGTSFKTVFAEKENIGRE
jgi:two-component sensor histidine kinase/CBS domain-containing protein